MEEGNKSGPLYPSLEYGAYLGLILVVASGLRTALFGFQSEGLSGWVITLLGIGLLAYFVKMYRDKDRDGTLSYGQGLGAGTLIGLFASLIMGVYLYVYLKLFGGDVISEMLVQTKKLLKEQDIEEEQLESMMGFYRSFFTPLWFAISGFFSNTFLYFIASLIIAAVFKRAPAHE